MSLTGSLLGEQSVLAPDGATVRSSRSVTLLAFLMVHAGVAQPRVRVAAALWPESTDAQALTNLRRELHTLRRLLGDESGLVVTPTDLTWSARPGQSVDVCAFAAARRAALDAADRGDGAQALVQAERAIGWYRGELLPGARDEWALEARDELERQCVELCDLVVRLRRDGGELGHAVVAARKRVELRPFEESGYRSLMELQESSGDSAAAVGTYHRCASVLERDLGVQPDRATRELLRRIISRTGTGRPDPPGATPTRGSAEATGGVPRARELVGRRAESATLIDEWNAAAAGGVRLCLVHGPAGVGKTRLVHHLATLVAGQGAVVTSTRCFGTAGRLTLAPVADWLRHPAVAEARPALDAVWRAEVERLLPPGGSPATAGTESRALADAWQRHRFLEGLARGLLAVRRPLLVVLDNAHWCDQESLAFLAFLVGLGSSAPVLVVATARDDPTELDREFVAWRSRMRTSGRLRELRLGPLGVADTGALAEAVTGRAVDHDGATTLHDLTGGFPLHVVEMSRATLDAAAPERADLAAVLRARLQETTDTARDVAGLAAAVGSTFTLDLLVEASDLGPDAVVSAVDELWRHRIVREFREGYDFSHDLLRDTAYAQVSPAGRWLLHRRIAQALELLHGDDIDSIAGRLADQYAKGGRPDRALAHFRRAAARAEAVFAHRDAVRVYERMATLIAAQPPGPGRDRTELEVLQAMSQPLNASEGYASPVLQRVAERAVALAEGLGDDAAVLRNLGSLWGSRFVQGRTTDAYEVALRARQLAGSDPERETTPLFAGGGTLISLGRPARGVEWLTRAAALSGGAVSLPIGTRPDVHGRAWAAHGHWLLGHDREARDAALESVLFARSIDHPYSLVVALAYGAVTHQLLGETDVMLALAAEVRELSRRHGFSYYPQWAEIVAGWAEADEPRIGRAIDALRDSMCFARMPYWLSLRADVLIRTGRGATAGAVLDAAVATARAHDDVWWLPEVIRQRAGLDQDPARTAGLREALRLAGEQDSPALAERCTRDLAAVDAQG